MNSEYVRAILRYDADTGAFTWLVRKGRQAAGSAAGCRSSSNGYINIIIDRVSYDAHRLAWLYMTGEWPSADVDHCDGVRSNNRWSNLRAATRSQNLHNCGIPAKNTSGRRGVCFDKTRNKWKAQICVERRRMLVGRFDTFDDAVAARAAAERRYLGEFIRADALFAPFPGA